MSWIKTSPWGDYSDSKQNNKQKDYNIANGLKSKLGFKFLHFNHKHIMSKKFADNHQKL